MGSKGQLREIDGGQKEGGGRMEASIEARERRKGKRKIGKWERFRYCARESLI